MPRPAEPDLHGWRAAPVVGLAVISLASLVSLPLAALADQTGRRVMLVWCCAGGLLLTGHGGAEPDVPVVRGPARAEPRGVAGAVVGLMAFGASPTCTGSSGSLPSVVFVPTAALAALFVVLPETRERELEEWEREA